MNRASPVPAERAAEKLIGSALPTRAISLKQPWCYLMLDLPPEHLKTIENRIWGSTFRGDCWVHASKGMTKNVFYDACEFALGAGVPRDLLPGFDQVKRGGIVGRWTIVDAMLPHGLVRSFDEASRKYVLNPHPRQGDRWHMPDQHGFIIENARPVPFVKCDGALGIWAVPEPVLAELRRAA